MSVQVAPSLRNTSLFTRLVVTACEDLANRSFSRFVTNVQKHNKNAIGLHRKLGFTIDEANASETSFLVFADPEGLGNERLPNPERTCRKETSTVDPRSR